MIIRSARYLALTIILLVLVAPLWLIGSAPGTRWALSQAQARLPVTIDYAGGSLLNGVSLRALQFSNAAVSLEMQDIKVTFAWGCLLRSTLCVRELSIARVSVIVPEDRSDRSSGGITAPLPWLPILLDVTAMRVTELSLASPTRRERFSDLELAGELRPKTLLLERLSGRHAAGAWNLGGTLSRRGLWDLVMTFEVYTATVPNWPEGLPAEYSLSASGDLSALETSLAATAQGGPDLRLQLAYPQGQGTMSVRGSFGGLAALVPALDAQAELKLKGPLQFLGEFGSDGAAISLRQQVAGYTAKPLELALKLSEKNHLWHLDEATLGDVRAPVLSVSGSLGTLDTLAPDLNVAFAAFAPPLGGGKPELALSGGVQLGFTVDDPLHSWFVNTRGLELTENTNAWSFAGELRASDATLFPLGRLSGTRNDRHFSYRRATSGDAAALLEFPEGLPGEQLNISRFSARVVPGKTTQAQLTSAGDFRGTLEVSLTQANEGASFAVEPFVLFLRDEAISSADVIEGSWIASQSAFYLEAFCLRWRGSRACGNDALLGESGALQLALDIDEDFQGAISEKPFLLRASGGGRVDLRWADAQLEEALFSIGFDELSVDPFMQEGTASPLNWEHAKAHGYLRADELALTLDLQSQRLGALMIDLGEDAGVLSGTVNASGLNVAAMDDLLPEWTLRSGSIESALRIAGSRSQPQIFGTTRLVGAAAQIPQVQTPLSEVDLTLEALGESFAIDGTAVLGDAPLALQGVCCDDGVLQASVVGDRNRLRLPVGLDARISPDLTIRLGTQSLAVSGQLTVHDGVLTHDGPQEGGIPVSEDFYRIDVPEAPPRRFDVSANLRTLIEPGFTLRSREIEATLSGDLRLDLRASRPATVFGDLKVLGGELRAYGQVLRLTEGSVGFVGDPFNPGLNLSAERRIRAEDLRVGFRVRGSLESPALEIFSDPVRSERDTLSYLLRGRGPDAGAGMDGTAMALSLGATAINQTGALESLNAIPGLSGVTLGAEGSDEDMAATISAYVGERLFLSYGVGIYEPVNALTARLYLRSRLWLEVVSRLESSFDLFYRFDID